MAVSALSSSAYFASNLPYPFKPCLDNASSIQEPFFRSDPLESLLRRPLRVPLMMGSTSGEGLILTALLMRGGPKPLRALRGEERTWPMLIFGRWRGHCFQA